MKTIELKPQPLTRDAFKPFGDVIETDNAEHFSINNGTVERFHDLAKVNVDSDNNGRAIISIAIVTTATVLPVRVKLLECHPLGSQAFIPLVETPLIIVVAEPAESIAPHQLRAFVSNGRQGINYRPGVWHMPLIAPEVGLRYLVVDRGGEAENCNEYYFDDVEIILSS